MPVKSDTKVKSSSNNISESNINQENNADEDDDMYGDLYGDLGDDNNVEEQQEVVDNVNSNNITITTTTNSTTNSTTNTTTTDDDDDNDAYVTNIENQITKHTIRKEIPFYLQNMSYDRLNIFHNPQGGFGVVHLLNDILSLIKN